MPQPLHIRRGLYLWGLLFLLSSLGASNAKEPDDFDSIIKSYLFVNDFSKKAPTRKISEHLFWKYPISIAPVRFPIYMETSDADQDIPAVLGDGSSVYLMNYGRTEFFKGNYEKARNLWLTCRQRFGKTHDYHRRTDYYIAKAFLALANEEVKAGRAYADPKVKGLLANAATFLSWALVVKEEDKDPFIEQIAPKQFYNLAAIYYTYGRFAGAYGAAEKALNFLAKTGRKDHRPLLRRILAESHIKNRTYLEAVKQLDTAIRQDPDPKQAAAMFARVGDIYFDQNNYELAEYAYDLANKLDRETSQINPAQYVLRGESLFWMGRFDEAQKNFHYALERAADKEVAAALPEDFAPKAHLRIADGYLALEKYDKAKLEYFRVMNEYRGTVEGQVARVRNACLELPQFEGNNVQHARKLLAEVKNKDDLPYEAHELAWACEVASYSQRERTTAMVDRVREFYSRYPESRFLASLVEPVRQVKADRLDTLFASGNIYTALSYFEKTRDLLFKDLSEARKSKLFGAYVDTFNSEKAREFWPAYNKLAADSDLKKLRSAAFLAESAQGKTSAKWKKKNSQFAAKLKSHTWTINPTKQAKQYLYRSISPSGPNPHLDWAYKLAKTWSRSNKEAYCSDVYPVLARMIHTPNLHSTPVSDLAKDATTMVKELLPNLLAIDETCGISFLELEFELLSNQPAELGRLYLSRREWRLTKPLTTLFWEVAEKNSADGQQAIARELWSIIRDKSPEDAPEVSFAKVRLDPSRTEYEDLWK